MEQKPGFLIMQRQKQASLANFLSGHMPKIIPLGQNKRCPGDTVVELMGIGSN